MAEPLRILMVEDLSTDAELEQRALREAGLSFVLRRVERRAGFVAALAEFRPDLIISDFRMPDFDGMEVLALTYELAPRTPVIVVTGSTNEETAAECIKAGAVDYVLKDQLGRLAPAVRTALDRKRLAEEAQQAREALEASERRYRALFQEARDGIFIADPMTQAVLDANRSALELAGRTVGEMTGTSLLQLVSPESLEQVRHAWEVTARGGATGPIELGLIRPDGSVVPVEARASTFEDADGNLRIVSIVRDVTRRRQEEQALRESEERFRAVVDGAPDGVFIQTDGRFAYLNPTATALFGATATDDLLGTPVLERVHPDFRAVVAGRIRVLHEDRRPVSLLEEVYLRLDGTAFEVEASAVPFQYGGRNGAIVFFRDITARKRSEAALAMLGAALEQAAEIAFVTDLDAVIQYVNPAFERITGYTRAEAVGQNPRILKSGVQGPEVYRRLWDTLTAGEVFADTFVNRKKNGDRYIAEVVISPVRDGTGRITQYIALQRDVTHEHDLADQLRQAQKMEALGQLTGGLAHDFNNLLGVILSNAALLKSELPADHAELVGYLADLDEAAQHGAAMVKKLLGFSRRETLSLTPTDLGRELGDFERTARRLIPETIAIRVRAPGGLIAVADAGALQQILLNLATNARDAMPDGGALTVSASAVEFRPEDDPLVRGFDTPGPYVCIAVTDSGEGMDQATLARALEPFFTTKAPGAGTGLGLPMVYGLMKQHGGFVRLYSEPGQGTTVRLYFPATTAPDTTAHRAEGTGAVRGTETVLVVEDQEMLRRATARALSKLGYTVLVAADGEQGLMVLAEKGNEIALVLSDVVMPTMGGIEMFRRVRDGGNPVRFLLMSGYAAGSSGTHPPPDVPIVEKPWTVEALSRKLREVLDRPMPA